MTTPWIGALLAFLSGACALVYEMTWLREFRLLFGASTLASSTVLALFIGGLGLGGALLGGRLDRVRDPFRVYLLLEAGIGLCAAVSPVSLSLARSLYLHLGGSAALGDEGATVLRLLLSAPVLLPPTILMGGTLPALARALESATTPGRHRTALLYGVNTLGAVFGSAVATFFLLERLGNRSTIWGASLVNLCAVGFGFASRRLRARSEPNSPSIEGLPNDAGEDARPSSAQEARGPGAWVVLALSALSGFVFFLMELVYYRMLGPLLGGSVFTLGLILSVALLGVGLGSFAYSVRAARRALTFGGLSVTFFLQALGLAVPFLLGDEVALLAARLQPDAEGSFGTRVVGWFVVTAVVVLPSALVAGFQFPSLVALLGRGRTQLAKHTGLAYAWNTVGSVFGALLGGFGLLTSVGATGVWVGTCFLLAVVSVLLAYPTRSRSSKARFAVRLASALTLCLSLVAVRGPTAGWRHSGIGVGRFPGKEMDSENGVRDFLHGHRRALLWEEDGLESSVALTSREGLAFVVNGKVDGHAVFDAPTAVMSGLLGALLHGRAERSLVIGLGTGSTAGWLAKVPTMLGVDVFEIERATLRVARDCSDVNQGALDNPKVRVTIGDARELLLTSEERYDVIFSEPSNPYRAGIAGLFTREFYAAVRRRLKPGGLFVQWVQAYEIDREAVNLVYATLGFEFAAIESWRTHRDLLLVATEAPLEHDSLRLRRTIGEEPFAKGGLVSWSAAEFAGVFSHFIGGPGLARRRAALHKGALNTDDRNLLEFGFARSVGRSAFELSDLLRLAKATGEDRPKGVSDAEWEGVPEIQSRLYAASGRAPTDLSSRTVVGLLEAAKRAASERRSLPPEEELRLAAVFPEVVAILRSLVAERDGEVEAALGLLRAVLDRERMEPWIPPEILSAGLRVLARIGLHHPRLASSVLSLIAGPFPMLVLDEQRREVALQVAVRHRMSSECSRLLEEVEPWIPWRRPFLERRVRCYEFAAHSRLEQARGDLARYLETSRVAGER